MTIGKQLSDGNPDGTTLGQSAADKTSAHGASPSAQYVLVSALATIVPTSVAGSSQFGFATSALMNSVIALVSDMRALLVAKGWGA
jgi:hypothetical protein